MAIEAVRDESSAPFFDAAARGELVVRSCPVCGRLGKPEMVCCPGCAHEPMGWTVVSGRATLVSWAVSHPRPSPSAGVPGAAGVVASAASKPMAAPVVLAIVELEEGPWLHTRLLDVDPSQARVGLPLTVTFVASGSETIPIFQLSA
jgi:uncharacterized OB-fold protein